MQGEWCPGLPTLPLVGKVEFTEKAPLPTYKVEVGEDGSIMVDVN